MSKVNSFNKKELEKVKDQRRKEKLKKKDERKSQSGAKSFDDMIAWVDEKGRITNTPPDPDKKSIEVDIDSNKISTQRKTDEPDPVYQGRVEYVNDEKGYGFIKDKASVEKYFFHFSQAPAGLTSGNSVQFELEKGPKGYNAIKIELIK